MASQLIIKSPKPGRNAILIIALLVVIVGVGYAMYHYGRSTSGFDYESLKSVYDNMQVEKTKPIADHWPEIRSTKL